MLYIDQPTQTGFSYDIPVPAYRDPTTGLIVALGDSHCPGELFRTSSFLFPAHLRFGYCAITDSVLQITLPTSTAEPTPTRTNRSRLHQQLRLRRVSGSHFRASWAHSQNTQETSSFSQRSPTADTTGPSSTSTLRIKTPKTFRAQRKSP